MSDGSLSQDEIDALLMGSDDDLGGVGAPAQGGAPSGNSLNGSEEQAVTAMLAEVNGSQSSTLSGIMVTDVTLGNPRISVQEKESYLSSLPDEVIEIKCDFTEGFTGGHLFVFPPETAMKIAEPMMGQENIELDATAVSSISEAVSQMNGAAVTSIGDKIQRNLLTEPPQGQKEPKAMLNLPDNSFVTIEYDLTLESGVYSLYEIFAVPIVKELASLLGAAPEAASAPMGSPQPAMQPQMGQPQMQQPMMQPQMGQPQMQQPMMQQPMNMGMNQQQMGMMQGMGMMGGAPAPNVQSVQYPDFSGTLSQSEQRNIGLLMDVSMEMSVELGRTKWLIKDILGIGEGTIIELNKLAGEPVDILVNDNLIARGEVVVIDESFGVRVTEIISGIDKIDEG